MWMNFGIKDLIDVLLVAFFLYQTYKLMKNSGTLAIFSGVVSFIIVWILVSQVLEIFSKKNHDKENEGKFIAPVVLACMNMAKKKTGALICIQQDVDLTVYEHTGEMFNADANARLIENIFFKNSPLHDGAMIIADNRIKAAGCILPVAQNANLPKDMGLRHRSGLGMSLETDALVIIVSEERGKISVAHNGKIEVNVTAEDLQQILSGEKEVTNYC